MGDSIKNQFKTPKSIKHSRLHNLSSQRLQPSPLKRELMLKDLGLEDDDTLGDVSSLSDDDDSSDDCQGNEIEINVLKKELGICNQHKSELMYKNMELKKTITTLSNKLDKEVKSKKSRLLIVQKANTEALEDKDNLILDLQDMLEEKIGNKDFKVFVDHIERLHEEKSALHSQLLQAFVEYEKKVEDAINNMEHNSIHVSDIRDRSCEKSAPVDVAAAHSEHLQQLSNLNREKNVLEEELQIAQRRHELTTKKYEEKSHERDVEIKTARSKIEAVEDLNKEMKIRLKKAEQEVKKQYKLIEEQKKVENRLREETKELHILQEKKNTLEKQYETLKTDLSSRLNEQQMESSKISKKLKEENEAVCKQLESLKMENQKNEKRLNDEHEQSMKILAEDKKEVQSRYDALRRDARSRMNDREKAADEICSKLKREISKIREELDSERKRSGELERDAADLRDDRDRNARESEARDVDLRARLADATEREREARDFARRQRDEMAGNYAELKRVSERGERQLRDEVGALQAKLKRAVDERDRVTITTEQKLMLSADAAKEVENRIAQLRAQLDEKTAQTLQLKAQLDESNATLASRDRKLVTLRRTVEESRSRVDELSGDMRNSESDRAGLQVRLDELSATSTSELAEKQEQIRDLKLRLSSCEDSLRVQTKMREAAETRDFDSQQREKELELRMVALQTSTGKQLEEMREDHEDQIRRLQSDRDSRLRALSHQLEQHRCSLRSASAVLRQLSRDNSLLRRDVNNFPSVAADCVKKAAKQISQTVSDVNEACKELVRRYLKEMKLRKKYHNELVEIRGNIRVFVRVRPRLEHVDRNPTSPLAVAYDDSDDGLLRVNNQKGRSQTYEVDRVFTDRSTQDEVYSEVQALVQSCMDGYHVCIFAYGQTGSGKTYTMEGTAANPGINQRALADLFSTIGDRVEEWEYVVHVSLLEIYNECLRDLLNTDVEKLDIKMNADGSLFVTRLVSRCVQNLQDVNQVFEIGRRNRATASTNMNEHSSRSHAVLVVAVHGTNKTTGSQTYGKLNLIDLAGSERVSKSGASGDRLKEAQNINRSLSALGDVIHALRNKQAHVPFRNSKLTYLLQDSLSKDSKTLMVVQVSPISTSVGETMCSLNFAQRVRSVELGQASNKKS